MVLDVVINYRDGFNRMLLYSSSAGYSGYVTSAPCKMYLHRSKVQFDPCQGRGARVDFASDQILSRDIYERNVFAFDLRCKVVAC